MLDIKAEISQSIRNRFYIGGEWVQSHSTRRVSVVNPATELELVDVPLADTVDVDHAIAAARHAFDDGPWTRMTGVQRSDYLRRFVELLARRADLLGWLWTAQVGASILCRQPDPNWLSPVQVLHGTCSRLFFRRSQSNCPRSCPCAT
jgi:delta 1-pyrroline-5-carboxylate dehydrogenase